MDVPPPPVPAERLADWRQTAATVERAFSTPLLTVDTHTLVYEETADRDEIHTETGIDHPWRFFFASQIQLDPPQRPSAALTSLVRHKTAQGFVDRLTDRGLSKIDRQRRQPIAVGDADGIRFDYRAVYRDTVTDGTGVDTGQLLSLPIAAMLAIWTEENQYRVAGGAYPSGPPDSGPERLTEALTTRLDPEAAESELVSLIKGCHG